VHDREYEGVLAEVEVLLGLEADLLAPHVFEVSIPRRSPSWPW
jgi:hypothetical protein